MSQKKKLLEHLKKGGRVTSLSAANLLGILSVSSRISELAALGHKIRKVKTWVDVGTQKRALVTVYSLYGGRNGGGR